MLLGDHLVTMGVRINPWGAMLLMDLMYDCKISHLVVHCSRQVPCEVDEGNIFFSFGPLGSPISEPGLVLRLPLYKSFVIEPLSLPPPPPGGG